MSITQNQLKTLSQLAYLEHNEHSAEQLAENVNHILNLAEQLTSIDTAAVAPLLHPLDLHQRLREDTSQADEAGCLAELEQISANFSDNLYWVPKVIDDKK